MKTYCRPWPPNLKPTKRILPGVILALALILSGAGASARIVYGLVESSYSLQGGPDRFRDRFGNALGGSAGVLLDFETNFQVVARFEYHQFGAVDASTIAHRGSLRLMMLGTMLRYVLFEEDEIWRPFLSGGYSTADLSLSNKRNPSEEFGTEYDGDDLQGVLQLGGGIQIKAHDRFWITIEARYVNIASTFGSDATTLYPLTLGIRF